MTATTSAPTSTSPSKNVFRLHGVNVLNRKNVDSISRLTALEKRRATHILDERQRRDTMNQLLGELANLVRESAAEAQSQSQQQEQSHSQQKQFNADGTEKKPPVKSNSITTLRNAIAEIRRLRSCAGLETATAPSTASSMTIASSSSPSPNASRSSSPTAVQAPQNKHYQPQQLFPALAPQYSGSRHSTPMSSPKAYPSHAYPAHHQHQLQSPPLSPSSPAHNQYSPSSLSVSPPMVPVHQSNQVPALPSLFAPTSPVAYSLQQPSQNNYYPSQQHHYPQQSYGYSGPQYNSPLCEPVQQQPQSLRYNSRASSPSSSGLILPQPCTQNPSMYQTSSY
ncbi:hypothetical protein EDD21DRAFT_364755 [Dissophora ornata]|nr:hypothetical protein BGZ58_004477 [Dissophora ornata]KAI8604980.1 hypothetical protein EDD21DRAFT_364755 [Dissophora ornata]